MTTETTQEASATDRPIAVTPGMLTDALTEFYLTVRSVRYNGYPIKGQVAEPSDVADVLHATLSRIAAERAQGETPAAKAVRDAGQVEAAMAILERRYPSARPDYLDIAITELQAIARSWRRQAAQVEAAGAAVAK